MNWKEVKELFFGKDEAIHHFKCCDNTIYMSQKETSQLTVMKIDENSRRIPEDPKKITLPSERKVANLDIKGDLLALCFTKQKIGMYDMKIEEIKWTTDTDKPTYGAKFFTSDANVNLIMYLVDARGALIVRESDGTKV